MPAKYKLVLRKDMRKGAEADAKLYYANDKRNGKSIIFFNVWEKVCFC